MKVENKDGLALGKVRDLIFDLQTGELRYAVVQSGGFGGLGSQAKLVPTYAMTMGTAKRNTIAVNVDKLNWEKTPTYKKGDFSRIAQLAQLYPRGGAGGPMAKAADLGPTGRTSPPASSATLLSAKELGGKEVLHRPLGRVGVVSDLLIDFKAARPPMALISGVIPIKNAQTLAISLHALRPSGKSSLQVKADTRAFLTAPVFDGSQWLSDGLRTGSGIYRYDDTAPDDTRRNVRDREPHSMTPIRQSEAENDLLLTRRVRQAVTRNDALSLTAKNVKIVTVDGRVTLRGPVHVEEEKTEIARVAAQIAGAENVDNQLEVKRD